MVSDPPRSGRDLSVVIYGGVFAALIVALITSFKPNLARITAPIYAVLEGIALGGISYIYEARFKGIPLIAVGLTFGVALAMLALYATRDHQRSPTGCAASSSARPQASWCSTFISSSSASSTSRFPACSASDWPGLLFSSAVVIVAAMNLLLNFDTIERNPGPRRSRWSGTRRSACS